MGRISAYHGLVKWFTSLDAKLTSSALFGGRHIGAMILAGVIGTTTVLSATTAVLPVSVLTVTPKPLTVTATASVSAREFTTFPALSEERVVRPTGRLKRAKATGSVQFVCCTSSGFNFFGSGPDFPDRIHIPAGVVVWSCASTADAPCPERGPSFKTTRAATITSKRERSGFFWSQYASEPVPVVAIRAGSAPNGAYIKHSSLKELKGTAIYVVSHRAPSGGANGTERYLRPVDVTRTVSAITKSLTGTARADLDARVIRTGREMIGFKVTKDVERNPFDSGFRDHFEENQPETVEVAVRASAFGYERHDLEAKAVAVLRAKTPPSYQLQEGSWDGRLSMVRFDPKAQLASIRVRGTANLADLDLLRQSARGQSPEVAAAAIEARFGGTVTITRRYRPFAFVGDRVEVRLTGL